MESITGKKYSPEDVKRVMEELERIRKEDEAKQEAEKTGIAKGAVAATLQIVGGSKWDWLFSKISPPDKPSNKLNLPGELARRMKQNLEKNQGGGTDNNSGTPPAGSTKP